ncbi:MAG: glycosyltransferase family 4 protein [Pseudomonadota bacterium]
MRVRPHIGHVNLAKAYRGGERQTQILIEQLAERGWQQTLVARVGGDLARRIGKLDGLTLITANNVVGAASALAKTQLVHAHDGRSIQAACLANLRFGHRYLVTRRVMNPIGDNLLTRFMYRRAKACVAISSAVAESVLEYDSRLRCEQIADAYHAVEPDPVMAAEYRARSSFDLMIGNVAALETDSKGQLTMLAAARAMPETGFRLIGSGRDEQMLKAAAGDLPNLVFEGQVQDVASHLAAMDIFAFPSLREGFGSVLLDAMRQGLPIVAFASGGIPDIVVDGLNGQLLPPGDDAGFIAALRRMAAEPDLRKQFAENNRRRAERFTPTIMTDNYERLYLKLSNR